MAYYSVKGKTVDAIHALLTAETVNRPADLQLVRMWDRGDRRSRRIEIGTTNAGLEKTGPDVGKRRWTVTAFIRAVTSWSGNSHDDHEELCAYIEAHLARTDLATELTAAVTNFRAMDVTPLPDAPDDFDEEHDEVITDYMLNVYCILEAT